MRYTREAVEIHELPWRVTLVRSGWLSRVFGGFNGIEFAHDVVFRRADLPLHDTPSPEAFMRMTPDELDAIMTRADDL